jgi:hypothetical protein
VDTIYRKGRATGGRVATRGRRDVDRGNDSWSWELLLITESDACVRRDRRSPGRLYQVGVGKKILVPAAEDRGGSFGSLKTVEMSEHADGGRNESGKGRKQRHERKARRAEAGTSSEEFKSTVC